MAVSYTHLDVYKRQGNWAERILPIQTYEDLLAPYQFKLKVEKGFYNADRNNPVLSLICKGINALTVSYTHLDVYKRQIYMRPLSSYGKIDRLTISQEEEIRPIEVPERKATSCEMCIRDRPEVVNLMALLIKLDNTCFSR